MIQTFYPRSLQELRAIILGKRPLLFCSAQSSTVIPYAHLEGLLQGAPLNLIDLAQMPASLDLLDNGQLLVKGPISWREAQDFCKARGRSLMAWPTETSAACLAGIATSATGEKSFGNGPLSGHLARVDYLNFRGEQKSLSAERPFAWASSSTWLGDYQKSFTPFAHFKNGPFPRFEREIDLMVGTEGQLGVIVEAEFKTAPSASYSYMFLKLPRWEVDDRAHRDLVEKVQNYRGHIQGCEFLDAHCLTFLDKDERPFDQADMVTLEIKTSSFEKVHDEFLSKLMVSENDMFEIEESKFHRLRLRVPQKIFEENSRRGITKKGTDIQVPLQRFGDLLAAYRRASQLGVDYGLFGHIGDRHLHFNFMPTLEQQDQVDEFLQKLYLEVLDWGASPFAEHGIGFLKRPFIAPYHGEMQKKVFKELKRQHDPESIFFPYGYMGRA